MKKILKSINWKLFGVLYVLGLIGVISIIPYFLEIQKKWLEQLPISTEELILASTMQNAVLIAIFIFVGLLLGKNVGLTSPLLEKWTRKEKSNLNVQKLVTQSIGLGVCTGIIIIAADFLFKQMGVSIEIEGAVQPAVWKGFLASFYGGITEELQLRLFFMTFIVWLMYKFSKGKLKPAHYWSAIIISAFLFGLGHLPILMNLVDSSSLLIFRTILLNMIGGIVFGWLFWKKGLESAIIAHFSGDIMLHVITPLLLTLL